MAALWEMQVSSGWVDACFKPPAKIEAGKQCQFTFQGIPCTIGFLSEIEGIVSAKDKKYPARPKALVALDEHEEVRRQSQKRNSNLANVEQMRIISEMQHVEHELKQERVTNRKSASEAVTAEQAAILAEHGEAIRKVPSVPDAAQLASRVKEESKHGEGELHPNTVKRQESARNSLVPLDSCEEKRRSTRLSVSNAASMEQLRIISEMEHADHELRQERVTNRKSARESATAEQAAMVAEHGDAIRKVPSVPDATHLAAIVPKDWQTAAHTDTAYRHHLASWEEHQMQG